MMHQRESLTNSLDQQKHAPLNFGVVLFAFGKPHYYGAAYNLAFSIKRLNSGLKIALYVDDRSKCYGYAHGLADYVDSINEIKPEHLSTGGKLDPGKLKVNLYEYLPFEHNIYLDVDAVALKDIEPMVNELINAGKDYISHTVGYHTIQQGRAIPSMQWAWADDIWQHFELTETDVMPAINSSIQFVRKSIESEKIFSIATDLYLNNPLPVHRLRAKWGGGQPDELYTNIALAKLGYDASMNLEPLYIVYKRELSINEVQEKYYLQGYFGGTGFTPRYYTEWIDRLLKSWMRQDGKQHIYFIERIIQNKYVTGKR
jgi:hypothetical protein